MLTFIAIPTAGTVKDGRLTDEFMRFFAELFLAMPDRSFWAPMVQDYQVLKFMNVAPTWEVWGQHCRCMIEKSDEVWVLMFPGWDTSVGVAGEIEHATKHQKVIRYIPVDMAPSSIANSLAHL